LEAVVGGTVLITGGLGCLGGKLSKYLINAGYQVVIGSSRQDAKLPSELKNCSLVYTDFNDINTLIDACCDIDSVIHLATVNAQQSQEDPELAIEVNGIGTHNLIQASIKTGIEYLLYFSTAHIYGSPLVGEIDESILPKPLHPYAITHRLAEDFVLESINNASIKGSVVRLSNSIGLPLIKEANCWMLFVNDVCKQAIVDRRIVIHSNPNSERDFIPMNAVCEIAEYFLSSHTTADYPIFNVGSGFSYTLLQIAEMIADRCEELFGFCPKIVCSENNSSQNLKLSYKVNKLAMEMGYVTNNNLNPSIDEVLRFCNAEFN
jgi:UDP-glucose 4-epimerase